MKTTINQRFDQMIQALGCTKNAFAKSLEVASTQIYNIINGRNAPSFDLLSKIAITYPTVNLTWLLTGKGSVLLAKAETGEEMRVLSKMKALEDQIADLNNKYKNIEKNAEKAVKTAIRKVIS